MVVKVALSAGHGLHTPGKRTPAEEREWTFNNKVVLAMIDRLNDYEDVSILRVDDPTEQVDVSLLERSRKENAWVSDVYVANHHNAYQGVMMISIQERNPLNTMEHGAEKKRTTQEKSSWPGY